MKTYFNKIFVWMLLTASIVSCTSGQIRKVSSTAPPSGRVYAGMTRLEAENIFGKPVMTSGINDQFYRGIYRYEEDVSVRSTLAADLLNVATAGLSSYAISPVDRAKGPEHFASVLFQREDVHGLNDMVVSVTYRFENSIEAMAWHDKSILNIKNGAWEDAIRNATMAIKIDPTLKEAYMGRAIAYYERGEYGNAVKDCSKVLGMESDNADAYHYRGMAYEKEGMLKKAERDFRKACRLNLPGACERLAGLSLEAGNIP